MDGGKNVCDECFVLLEWVEDLQSESATQAQEGGDSLWLCFLGCLPRCVRLGLSCACACAIMQVICRTPLSAAPGVREHLIYGALQACGGCVCELWLQSSAALRCRNKLCV